MTRRVPSRRSALEERSRKGAPPVRSASNLDNCPFKRRKRHSENGAALSCDIAYAPERHILSRRHRLLSATDKKRSTRPPILFRQRLNQLGTLAKTTRSMRISDVV